VEGIIYMARCAFGATVTFFLGYKVGFFHIRRDIFLCMDIGCWLGYDVLA
jgi:hypothetical protein